MGQFWNRVTANLSRAFLRLRALTGSALSGGNSLLSYVVSTIALIFPPSRDHLRQPDRIGDNIARLSRFGWTCAGLIFSCYVLEGAVTIWYPNILHYKYVEGGLITIAAMFVLLAVFTTVYSAYLYVPPLFLSADMFSLIPREDQEVPLQVIENLVGANQHRTHIALVREEIGGALKRWFVSLLGCTFAFMVTIFFSTLFLTKMVYQFNYGLANPMIGNVGVWYFVSKAFLGSIDFGILDNDSTGRVYGLTLLFIHWLVATGWITIAIGFLSYALGRVEVELDRIHELPGPVTRRSVHRRR